MGAKWAEHTVWWHVYPLGFTGAEKQALPPGEPPRDRLAHIEGWLDYAVALGCSGLLLGPIFEAETHGYDTVDHFAIDRRLGDDAAFDRLVAAARERGLRLVLDGVFNHVGRGFPAFVRAEAGDPAYTRWFRRGDDGEYADFEGHRHLVALDHDEPAVLDHVVRVMTHWLDRGASGWRLDAAYAVPPAFWREALARVRRAHPGAWFAGEKIHGDYAAYAEASGLDSLTQYELWKAIWSSLNDRNFFELAWALDRHVKLLDTFVPQTFAGNHDVTRLADRLADERHLGHALAVLLTVAGVPSVYYGDEQGLRGVKEERAGGDDAIRPAFPDRPGGLDPAGLPVYRLHQRLIALRRRHPWLVRARTAAAHLTNRAVALRSEGDAGQTLITLLNVDDEEYRFPLDLAGLAVAGSSQGPERHHGDPAVVPAHGWTILA
ncbi:glycosidase [Thermocatellispora tengchongensis]|uniref:Glycosidase n=1 Tax=Thermocatellispora tengchongensis TaxID=1073253 RepID=A0A840PES2_9ACTN|nr:alpha-amylase family glycosyl hydrolase [Thermocatellispora tengchongensis]MBB5136433.1 glycosidase [Thermocatellispora tengchongensis]